MNLIQVNMMVEDFAGMLAFYRDRLGFTINDLQPGPPCVPLVNWASLNTGSAVLELFDVATFGDATRLRGGDRASLQLCFLVDDAEAQRVSMIERGIVCDDVIEEEWGRFAGFLDPEGNRLQIFEVFDRGH